MYMIFEIVDKAELTGSCVSFLIYAPEITEKAEPGQFVHIKCGDSLLLRRPISICDVVGDNVKIVVDVRGEGTRWIAERQPGDMLDMLGPLGHGFTVRTGERLLLVGGGIGAPPLMLAARRCGGTASAVIGFRSAENVVLQRNFEKLCKSVTICTDDGTMGHHCFVDKLVHGKLETEPPYDRVLVCGPRPMMEAVAKVCAEFGTECEISMEERMGCGVGVCLACACKVRSGEDTKYLHVCRNGPVFNATEVVWNG